MEVIISQQRLTLSAVLGQGAAGTVYEHPHRRDLVVKIYLRPEDCEEARIKWLCANPPGSLWERGQPTFAWPLEAAYEARTGEMIGFVMPKAVGCVEAQAIVDPGSRSAAINRDWLAKVAISFLTRIHALHLKSYIVGDINFRNILVSRRGTVTIIDVDSFHVAIPNGPTFPTLACRPELQPPELVEAVSPILDRDIDQDAFSAYIVVYRLLCQGVHPFSCLYLGQGDLPLPHELIRQGIWPDTLKHALYRPAPCQYPFTSLSSGLQECFRQMFDDGLTDRVRRPNVTDLLICLRHRRSLGSRLRGRVGRLAWGRQLQSAVATGRGKRLRNAAGHLGRHKGKIAVAGMLLLGYAAESYEKKSQQAPPPAIPSLNVVPSSPAQPVVEAPSAVESAPSAPAKPSPKLLPTPQLWRQASDTIS